jgi:predicted transcriptional regulator
MHTAKLPPSSRKIMGLLEGGEQMTHKELVQQSDLAPRTVRYALKKLKEQNLIIEKFNFRDARQIIYQLRPFRTELNGIANTTA